MRTFFFDTYAFYEIIIGNPNYLHYTKDVKIVTTKLNLMELYYQLLSLYDKKEALVFFNRYMEFAIQIDDSVIIEAMDFRKINYKRNLSYIDCLGYMISKKMNAPFLTGDTQFKDFENVEYVK